MSRPLRLMHVENSVDLAGLIERLLREEFAGIDIVRVGTLGEMKKRLADGPWDMVLAKYRMPRFDAFAILKWMGSIGSTVPLIVVSSVPGRDAVSLFRAGARDIIGMDALARMPLAIRREIEHTKRRTQQRQTETALRDSRNSLRTLFDSTDEVVAMVDADGKILVVNRATARRFKRKPEELKGRNITEFFSPDDARPQLTAVRRAIKSKAVIRQEFPWKGKILDATFNPVIDENGKATAVVVFSRDVTHLRRAEEALRASEARLRAFMQACPESLYLKDGDGRYLAVSPAFERRHGVSADDAIGKLPREVLTKDRGIFSQEEDRKVLAGRRAMFFESDKFDAIGRRLVEKVLKFPVEDANGSPIGMGGISIDITQIKEAQEALVRSNRALRALSACNEVLVRAKTEDDLLKVVCDTIVNVGGYPLAWVGFAEHDRAKTVRPVALSGRPDRPSRFYHPTWASGPSGRCPTGIAIRTGELSVVRDGFKAERFEACRSFAEENGYTAAVALPLKIGTRVAGALTIFSGVTGIFDEEELALLTELANNLNFGVGALREATERERVEEERHKLSRAVEQSPTIVIITDAQGIIEYVNPKFTEVTGYDAREVVGKRPNLLKSGETDDAEYATLWTTIAAGHQWHGVFHNRRKDGAHYWADSAISPVKAADGTITHFIEIQEDISEQLETQQRLKQMEKMESLGNLAGGIAHDFNNMLLPIQSLTSMTLRDLPEDSPAARRLRKVIEASQRAGELVKRILTFSRSEETHRKPEDIHRVVGDAMALLRSTIPATVRIVERAADVGEVVMDSAQIQTVLLNLASNAADAMNGRTGTLFVSLSRARIGEPLTTPSSVIPPGDYARITVQDTGSGMSPEVLEHVFEPFFTTKGVGEGTGLGLAMVHGIVTKHGGAITATSELGVGTTFDIFLPVLGEAGGSEVVTQITGGVENG